MLAVIIGIAALSQIIGGTLLLGLLAAAVANDITEWVMDRIEGGVE